MRTSPAIRRIRLSAGSVRRKWAARLLAGALAVTAVLIGLAYRLRSSRREQPFTVPQNLPGNVNQQLSGYNFTRSNGEREVFTIHAARTLNLKQGGPVVLEDVVVQLFGPRSDRRDVLRTHHARYDAQTGDFTTEGQVEIELNTSASPDSRRDLRGSPSVRLETSNIYSRDRGAILTTDDPVKFQMGPASGSARGLTYSPKDVRIELKSDVHAQLEPGPAASPVRLTARRLRYEKQNGQVVLLGPVEVAQGSRRVLAGRGQVSLSATNRVVEISLDGHVQASGALQGQDPRQGIPSAGSEKEKRTPTFVTLAAQRVQQEFEPDTGEPRRLVAEGAVQVESRGIDGVNSDGASGRAGYGSLHAQSLEIFFAGNPAEAQRGVATGSVEIRIEPARPAAGPGTKSKLARVRSPSGLEVTPEERTLKASQVRFTFHPGGLTLNRLETVGSGELALVPADPKSSRRIMKAGQLVITFDPSNRPERVLGLNGTRLISEVPETASETTQVETSADRLEATLDSGTATLKNLEQTGNFRFTSAGRQGRAEEARYSAQNQTTTLTGHPEVWDSSSRIRADRILMRLDSETAEGLGHVESSRLSQTASEPRDRGIQSGKGRVKAEKRGAKTQDTDYRDLRRRVSANPQSIASAGTINVLADRVVARRRDEFAHYEGRVRAWQGLAVIESSWLDFYGKEGRLKAGSPVYTCYLESTGRSSSDERHLASSRRQPASGEGNPAGPSQAALPASAQQPASHPVQQPLIIQADMLEVLQSSRQARYTGNVQAQTAGTTLTASQVDVYFSGAGGSREPEIDHVTADGHVKVTQPGRRAWGDHAEYMAVQGRITLRGGSPTLEDEQTGSTTGQSLTFSIRDDTLRVDGGDKSPTLSKYRVTQ